MIEKTPRRLLVVALVAIAVLCAAAGVSAQNQQCYGTYGNGVCDPSEGANECIKAKEGKVVLEICPKPGTGQFPWISDDTGKVHFEYLITNNTTKPITHQLTAWPACMPLLGPATTSPSGAALYPPGAGDPTTKWLLGDFQSAVFDISFNVAPGIPQKYWFELPAASLGEISAVLNLNGVVRFSGPILGPTCVGEEPIERVATFTKTEGNNTCTVQIHFTPNFYMTKVSGTCTVDEQPKSLNELLLGSAVGTAVLMQKGWFSYHASPGTYCYCNPVTSQYQCYYW